jgi:hypothetical protein
MFRKASVADQGVAIPDQPRQVSESRLSKAVCPFVGGCLSLGPLSASIWKYAASRDINGADKMKLRRAVSNSKEMVRGKGHMFHCGSVSPSRLLADCHFT